MPYNRKYKKRFYKKYSRKGKYTKYQTYKNRGATAQANQIYGLSKRITNIEKKTRPEYLTLDAWLGDKVVPSSLNWYNAEYNALTMDAQNQLLVITPNSIHGSAIRMIKLIVWGSITKIPQIQQIEQVYDSADTYKTFDPHNNPILLRLITGLLPRAGSAIPTPTEFFKTDGTHQTDNFKAPLLKGCGQLLKIKKYKKYQISLSNQSCKTFKFTVPLYGAICRKVEGLDYPYQNPLIYASILNTNFNDTILHNDVQLSINARLIYTDA